MRAELLTEDGGVLRVRFTNDTSTTEWLSKARGLVAQQPDSSFLETMPASEYIGRILHRLPYRERELIKLAPGTSVESDSFRLEDFYRLPVGPVEVRYAAAHPLQGLVQVSGPLSPVESSYVQVEPASA